MIETAYQSEIQTTVSKMKNQHGHKHNRKQR